MPKHRLDDINAQREAAGESPFANPRNAAAGSLRLLDAAITASRPLDIFIYALNYAEGFDFATHTESLESMRRWGLKCNPSTACHTSIEDVQTYYQQWVEKRHALSYEVDGIVVKVNQLSQRQTLGPLPNIHAGQSPTSSTHNKPLQLLKESKCRSDALAR